jgi:mannose-6-phosphate isomerase class I
VTGATLRSTLAMLATRPFRTRPTVLPGPWGGQWLRRRLGVDVDGPNVAWSYELIAPEAGILVDSLEVGLELLLAQESERVLGNEVAARFGTSFPIRFDYLDTFDGGHLSIQCHPREDYMAEVYGLPYTQLETYYVMETTPGAKLFLGLQDTADIAAFEQEARAALRGEPFEPERYVQAHAAERHRLYLIPAGTVHASGAGNVVLEISATPYLYTLRFYDWLRRDLDDRLRPVHLEHAFANLDPSRRGETVTRDLIQEPEVVRSGHGWAEVQLGRLPELFFAVHRLDFDGEVADDTHGRFHVLSLVDGDDATIETHRGDTHALAYAETIVVPADVGAYRLRGRGKAVKAFVV